MLVFLRCYTQPGSLLAVARADLWCLHILTHHYYYRLSMRLYIEPYNAVLPLCAIARAPCLIFPHHESSSGLASPGCIP